MSTLTIDSLPEGYTIIQDEHGGHWIKDPNGHVLSIPEMVDFLKGNHLVHRPPPKDSNTGSGSTIAVIALAFVLYKMMRK